MSGLMGGANSSRRPSFFENSTMRTKKAILLFGVAGLLLTLSVQTWAQIGEGWKRETPSASLHHAVQGRLQIERHIPRQFDDGLAHYDDDGTVQTFVLYKADSNRIEIRVNNDYDHGMRQFEGWVWVDAPTGDESIMQIFGGLTHATASMFRAGFNVNGGELRHGSKQTIASGIYRRWMRLNVIHDADRGIVSAYTDGTFAGQWPDSGPATHYFKYGAYGTHDDAHPAIVKWKRIGIFHR